LDFPTAATREFLDRNLSRFPNLTSYTLPSGRPRPGELYVQKSFSHQWERLDVGEELQYGYTEKEIESIWGIALGGERGFLEGKSLLNLGCGAGKEAVVLQRYSGAEVFAVDLNFSLLALGERVRDHPRIHFVQASVFSLPFRERSFDYVFSHGVLMHTYSTKKGVEALSRFVRPDGTFYFWVYGHRPMTSTYSAFWSVFNERIFRPLLSRMPGFVQTVILFPFVVRAHQTQKKRYHEGRQPNRPTWRNTWLMARDYLTPRHASWQSMAECIVWLKELGFKDITPLELEKIPKHYWYIWAHNVGLRSKYPE